MLKDVFYLTFSSFIGQLINLVVLIFVARLVTPDEYGIYTICLTLVGYVVVVASAKYQHAIFSSSAKESEVLTAGSQFFAFFLSTLALAMLVVLRATGIWSQIPVSYFPLVGGAGYLSGISLFFYYLALKKGDFRKIIYSRIVPPLGSGAVMLLLTNLGYGVPGIFIGYIIGLIIMCICLGFPSSINVGVSELKDVLVSKKKFPQTLLPAGVIETFNASFLVLTSLQVFGLEMSAALGMYYRVILSPQGMLSTSIGDAFKRKISNQESKKVALEIFKKNLFILTLGAIVGAISIYIFSYFGLTILFGEKWAYAGSLFRWMIPLFFASFIVSPLSGILYIYNGQHYDLYLQILLAAGSCVCYMLFKNQPQAFIISFIGISIIKYILELYLSYSCMRE